MKKIIVALVITSVMLLSFNGCGGGKGSLLGRWTTTTDGITISREFKGDGTIIERVSFNSSLRIEGTYTTDDGKINISMTQIINEKSRKTVPIDVDYIFSYTVKKNTLTLTDLNLEDGGKVIYKKE